MRTLLFTTALLSAGILAAPFAMAQQTASPNSTHQTQDTNTTQARKQRTDGSDVTSQYNFSTPGGQYSQRPGTSQSTNNAGTAAPR
jgi:hypothetical protein